MGSWKSQVDVDVYVGLLSNVLADAYQSYPDIPSHEQKRDKNTILARVRNEGLEFLTKTLPKLGKALILGLETGQLTVPSEFAKKRQGGVAHNIPKLFSALFMTIFNAQGSLAPSDRPAVAPLRQLCLLCYKLEIPHTPEQAQACEDKYTDIEAALPSHNKIVASVDKEIVRRARWLLKALFQGFDASEIVPRHGPGAVADRGVRGREKYNVPFYSETLDRLYPYSGFATFGVHTQTLQDLMAPYKLKREIIPAKVVLVPKDSRGPRVISCEPALLQFLQQGLSRKIVDLVESHDLTRGSVHFTDQQPNRDAAFNSSIDGSCATIDLADASDRVSVDLVRLLFPEHVLPYLLATRSTSTQLPSGRIVLLKKFAPMGSALCFPIEALTFWAITRATVWAISRKPRLDCSRILVYGDDIIVPTRFEEQVVANLEAFGLKVNRDKCFARGQFRESCGCDAFNGEDVTPVKIRVLCGQTRDRRLNDVCRLSENAKNFFDRGYWCTAEYLWSYCETIVGQLPVTGPHFQGVSRTSAILPPVSYVPKGTKRRWNVALQRWEIRTIVLKARKVVSNFPSEVTRLIHDLTVGMHEAFDERVAVPHTALPKAVWSTII